MLLANSVTRLGDLLGFGQVFKALATINLPQSITFFGNFCKGVKNYHFWGNFCKHLVIFSGHTAKPTRATSSIRRDIRQQITSLIVVITGARK